MSLKHWMSGIAAATLLLTTAHAAPPPAELFFKGADIVEAVLSPSGRLLAVTSARGAPRESLMVIDLDTGKATRTAQLANYDITRIQWVNDKRLLFSVTDLALASGEGRPAPGLFAINADGSEQVELVRRFGVPVNVQVGGKAGRILNWNHYLLRVPTSGEGALPDEVLMAGVDQAGYHTPLWLNTRTAAKRTPAGELPGDVTQWMADARGELRVAFTLKGEKRTALWRAPGRDDWRPLYETGANEAPPFTIHAMDDSGQLFVLRVPGKGAEPVLSRYDFARNAPDPKPLVLTPGFGFSGQLVTDSDGAALGVRVITDAESTAWFLPAMKALQQEADARFPDNINRINCRRCGQPDMTALVRSFSDRDPGRLWIYQAQPPAGSPHWRSVGRVREDIDPARMAPMSLERIQARDGRDLPVWITRPAHANKPQPAVVLVHGGPWVRGGVWSWRAEAQFLASRGYVVIEPEFRGSTGYGVAHYRAGFKQWGQAMQDDVTDALKWAQKQGIASDKACIAGASYGGYSTLMGLVRDPELYRCGVAWLAVTDLELLVKGSWWVDDDTSDEARKHRLPTTIGDPDKDAAMLADNSPVKQAARIKAPVLLAYGEQDRRVPLAHGKRMRDALKEAGNPPEWVIYEKEGHGFGLTKNRVDFAQRMKAFLAKHLQP